MRGQEDWLAAARSAEADDLREHILSGYKGGKPFTPYVPTIPLPVPLDRVLDFGCGLGRNFPYLKTVARHVTGFDLPPMIERCRTLARDPVDALTDDWNATSHAQFDLVFASLVLQHIEPEISRAYFAGFARMAPAVYLLSRLEDDFGTNVFQIVADTGLFEAGECVKVDHDPETNQLKTLGSHRFDDVRQYADGGHYEVVLRSKPFIAQRAVEK